MADVELDKATDRVKAGLDAGNTYTSALEDIRDKLDKADSSGTTLGNMVEAQLNMVEAETKYQVEQGVPQKASKAVKTGSDAVKQASN